MKAYITFCVIFWHKSEYAREFMLNMTEGIFKFQATHKVNAKKSVVWARRTDPYKNERDTVDWLLRTYG